MHADKKALRCVERPTAILNGFNDFNEFILSSVLGSL